MTVFSFLNPFLLWGLAAVSAPILIHLLLRQKPRPRPWAAMRWLEAALHAAQRRYKLTNLLLLLMRCLIIALLALAVARPHWGLWSEGGDLVLLVDVSASMSANEQGEGPLQYLRQQLREQPFSHDRVCLISVGHQTRVLSDGDADAALQALEQLDSDLMPGGLNQALEEEALQRITAALQPHSTVLCISDFRQDDGMALVKTLRDSVHQISRWQIGSSSENAYVHDIPSLPDFVAHQARQFQIQLSGQTGEIAQVSIDGGSPTPVQVQEPMQISVPPLAAGRHVVTVNFEDQGLAYDNQLELAITVRGAIPCVVVQRQFSFVSAVIDAAHEQLQYRKVDPARLHTEPLPDNGIVVLDSEAGSMERLLQWVNKGGVLLLWSDHIEQHQDLLEQCDALRAPKDALHSGQITSDDLTVSRSFDDLRFENLPTLDIGATAAPLLHLDEAVLAGRQQLGDGFVILVSSGLRGNDQFWTQGAAPYWLRSLLRDTCALAHQPAIMYAGQTVDRDLDLQLPGDEEVQFVKGDPLLLQPGLAHISKDQRDLIILPSREESNLNLPSHPDLERSLQAALPDQLGSDWSLWFLLALSVLCLFECLFAGHAGRSYGQ